MMERNKLFATFAGGCFWCMQPPFQETEGVLKVVAGYAGGTLENPSYEEVSRGSTGHLESVQVTYDPEKISYEKLLEIFWRQIDPTDRWGQFADKGSQYRTAIFYHDEKQKRIAEISRSDLDKSGLFKKPIVTEIRPYTNFYPAEEYHQSYANKRPREYHHYKINSGREAFLQKMWKGERVIKIYSTPTCHHCREIKDFLTEKHLKFDEIDLTSDEKAREMIIERTGHLGAPIVQIEDEFIFGFDRKKMERLLN